MKTKFNIGDIVKDSLSEFVGMILKIEIDRESIRYYLSNGKVGKRAKEKYLKRDNEENITKLKESE